MSAEPLVENEMFDNGLNVRRQVLGAKYVDDALSYDDDLSIEFQRFMTTYCWGEIWTDDRLAPVQHSLIVLAVTAALGKTREFEIHARGALRNGLTADQLTAVVRQLAVYAGVPAAVAVLASARNAIQAHQRESTAE